METEAFLKAVVTTPEGWFNLLVGPPSGAGWHEEWFAWPHDLDKIVERAKDAMKLNNVYYSAHLFETKRSTKDNVLPSATIQCDIDNGTVPAVNPPTILVETSPGRHQGYWILRDPMQPELLEPLSKQVTYSIPDGDRSSWSLGHKMRLPNTFNHKYPSGPKLVKVLSTQRSLYKSITFGQAQAIAAEEAGADDEWAPEPLTSIGPRELWASIKGKVPRRVVAQYDHRQPDRSAALWALMLALFRAGCDRNQVFWLSKGSANNKFEDNRYHGDLDLAKDVLRAERLLRSGSEGVEDIRTKVLEARRLPGLVNERRAYITALVRDSMEQQGTFIACDTGEDFFIREDTGRPIPISRSNDYLNSLLEIRFGLNATEPEQKYVINSLISTVKERGKPGLQGALSYFDKESKCLLVHGGRRDVYLVDHNSISTIGNGQMSVVFPWQPSFEAFDPDLQRPLDIDNLFDGCFDNLDELQPNEAMALMKAWLYFMLFRSEATARPLLALLGQPGSGKSTLFRRVYAFIYGGNKALNSVTSAEDFDHAVAYDPLVVFDNVDTFTSWLPDKLALSAASSDLVKRKLYTDSDTVVLRRQALVGITAHNPKFRREDIVDRLLMLNFHRLSNFKPEANILAKIVEQRDALWGGFLLGAQRILATPRPAAEEVPQSRVNDFARIGLWISRALDFEEDFRKALARNIKEQVSFNLEEEDILIETIEMWLGATKTEPRFYSVGDLWNNWSLITRDNASFTRMYRNAVSLGKKLWALQDTLSAVFNVDYELSASGVRTWRFSRK